IVSDIGSQAVSPFSSELDSSLQQSRGFVELPAGTSAFVMVTTLPSDEKGADRQPDPPGRTQDTVLANSDQSGAITDDELAALLTSGDPKSIREALPRMSPDVRRVAETLLTETSDAPGPRE
ncbi:MAG: hypothetical protein ACREAC_33095, partial [Blastocatellia bacterium]